MTKNRFNLFIAIIKLPPVDNFPKTFIYRASGLTICKGLCYVKPEISKFGENQNAKSYNAATEIKYKNCKELFTTA